MSVATAHYWLTARKRPDRARRVLIEQRYGVAPSLWDEYPDAASSDVASPDDSTQVDSVARLNAMAHQLMDQIQTQLDLPVQDQTMTALEMGRALKSVTPILSHISRLRGEYDVSRRIFATPTWRRIEQELATALEGHPEAAQAVAERFERLKVDERAAS